MTSGSELHILSLEAVSALVKDWSTVNLLGGAASAFLCALPRPIQQYHVSGKSFPFSFPFRAWTALDKKEYYRQFSMCFSLFWTALYTILHTTHNSNPSPAATWSQALYRLLRIFLNSERAHAAAPPFQIEAATLGFDLVFGADLKMHTSILR